MARINDEVADGALLVPRRGDRRFFFHGIRP
jgi:hypothetical protein